MEKNSAPPDDVIRCKGVRTHNLKNVAFDFKLRRWTAITGVSGSGKSSLAFDTVYAEAQRRFLETLGTYERQFLQGLPEGEFDSIENLPAAIALKQTNRASDPRSLVGTSGDVFEPLRQIFFALMDTSCARCGSPVEVHTTSDLFAHLVKTLKGDSRVLLTVPFEWPADEKKRKDVVKGLLSEGYFRVVEDGKIINLEDALQNGSLAGISNNPEILLDRFSECPPEEELKNRIESVWSQVRFSPRFSRIFASLMPDIPAERAAFMVRPFCKSCNAHTMLIQGSDLDWQSVLGACPRCKGLGNVPVIDENKVIPDERLSLEKGAIKPWVSETFSWMNEAVIKACKTAGVKTSEPYSGLDAYTKKWIWTGADPKEKFKVPKSGIALLDEFFKVLEAERYKRNSRILLAKYRKYVMCEECHGARLGRAGRNATAGGIHFSKIMNLEIEEVLVWFGKLKEQKHLQPRIEALSEVYKEVDRKLTLLCRLGLGSGTLSRRCKTLSGGEYQRVLLSRVLGNGLTDALYVLDEPSVGLGKNEIPNLIACLRDLRALGNTVLMVEHDPMLIEAADEWVELGPGGGVEGGSIVERKGRTPRSFQLTAVLPDGMPEAKIVSPDANVFAPGEAMRLKGFSALNCHNLNLELPFGRMSVVTGPSGAGKTSLIQFGLAAALELCEDQNICANSEIDLDNGIGSWEALEVPKNYFSETILVSVRQRAMHRSVTSVVATVLGVMELLRKHFATSPMAVELDMTASDFSFNGGGACETCAGRGIIKEDLFFLGEVDKECPDCHGKRYRKDVLEVQFLGKNISQWLDTNVKECVAGFKKYPKMAYPLMLAAKLGLGHLPLGASTSEISGGEAQRLRLCSALSEESKRIFCILDEPTRGLSEKDIGDLLATLLGLCSQGHTFVVVEHHELFQKYAHQLVELGPGAGANGGKIVKREVRCL